MSDTTNDPASPGTEPRAAFIARTVARALAPYQGLLDPTTLAEFAAFMETALDCHPISSELVARARPRAVPAGSGEEPLRAVRPGSARDVTGGGSTKR